MGLAISIGAGAATGDLSATGGTLWIPVRNEADFRDLLQQVHIQLVKNGDDYFVDFPGSTFPARLTFKNGYAQFWMSASPAEHFEIDAKQVLESSDPSLASLHVRFDRIPDSLKTAFLTSLKKSADQTIELQKQFHRGPDSPEQTGMVLSEKILLNLFSENLSNGRELGVSLNLEPKTGLFKTAISFQAKPGSELAKSIATTRPTHNKLASLLAEDEAAALLVHIEPAGLQEFLGGFIHSLSIQLDQIPSSNGPELDFVPILKELLKQIAGTMQSGNAHLLWMLAGPDQSGAFLELEAIQLDDTTKLEAAFRAAAAKHKDLIQLDIEKVEGIGIHKLTLPEKSEFYFMMKDMQVAGPICLAFKENCLFVATGAQSQKRLAKVLRTKLTTAANSVVDLQVSPARIEEFYKQLGATKPILHQIEGLPKSELLHPVQVSVQGGEKLDIHVDLNIPALIILKPRDKR
ncbi:MAG TPA: hypothetical protein VFE24_17615 [Pirellulales bacterium]|nr:hypothetical protein [Pirellulales bacterium]